MNSFTFTRQTRGMGEKLNTSSLLLVPTNQFMRDEGTNVGKYFLGRY
jgi:hypothetical protein